MGSLTQPQTALLASLPADHLLVGEQQGEPVVKRPDGRLVCVQPDGEVTLTMQVLGAQSYLSVERC